MDTEVVSHKPLKGAAKASKRAWDLAASVGGNWTAGVRLARSAEGTFQVQDVVRVRGGAGHSKKSVDIIMVDWERIVADLEILHRAASQIDGWDKDQVATFIRVGEWGLALDDIAYAYLKTGTAMPTDLFQIFERLAVEMEMEGDEEYGDVTQLRAETKARLG